MKNVHVPLALLVPVTARNPRSFLRVRLQDGHSASGKFSIRIVPNQTPDKINELVKNHLGNMWKLIIDLIIVDEPEKSIEAIELNELTGSILK